VTNQEAWVKSNLGELIMPIDVTVGEVVADAAAART